MRDAEVVYSGGDAGSRLIFFGAGIAGRLGVGMSERVGWVADGAEADVLEQLRVHMQDALLLHYILTFAQAGVFISGIRFPVLSSSRLSRTL
jgi:hypothetical protein